jgi:transcription antitermination factor NusG
MEATESSAAPWYAVQTRPGSERLAATVLAHKGYEVYYPLRPEHNARKHKDAPLFPSYLFCRSRANTLGLIVTTPGVMRLLGLPGRPEPVAEREIEGVRQMLEAGLAIDSHCQTAPGDWVRIEQGPLRGVIGQVVRQAENLRLVVTVQLLQRSVSIALEPSWLETGLSAAAAA